MHDQQPVPLRPASRPQLRIAARRPEPPALLGPSDTAEDRIAALLRQVNGLYQQIEDLGGREVLFRHVGEKAAEMRLEGESRRQKAGLPSAFGALPIVRDTEEMLARDIALAVSGDVGGGP